MYITLYDRGDIRAGDYVCVCVYKMYDTDLPRSVGENAVTY